MIASHVVIGLCSILLVALAAAYVVLGGCFVLDVLCGAAAWVARPFRRWLVTRATHEAALADIARHRSQIADLHDSLNEARANIDEMRREHEAAIERLTDPRLADIHMEPGGLMEMGIEASVATKILAAGFAQLIGEAPNWSAFEVGPFETWQGTLLVTVRRMSGESPEVQLRDLKAKLAEAEKDLDEEQGFINNIDTTISEALEKIGRFPGPPAGFPDRVDVLCKEVIRLHESSEWIIEANVKYQEVEDSLTTKVAELEEALAAEQAEAVKQFGLADDAQDRVTNLEVELKLAVDTIRKLRDTCILSRVGLRSLPPIFAKQNTVEIRSCSNAIDIADRFLAPHTTPEIAAR